MRSRDAADGHLGRMQSRGRHMQRSRQQDKEFKTIAWNRRAERNLEMSLVELYAALQKQGGKCRLSTRSVISRSRRLGCQSDIAADPPSTSLDSRPGNITKTALPAGAITTRWLGRVRQQIHVYESRAPQLRTALGS